MNSTLQLATVSPQNVREACQLTVRPEQERMVAPVASSLAEAYADPDAAWPRLVYDGDRLVGFVMGGFAPDAPHPALRCAVWRLNVAADVQRRGYGRFAVEAVIAEARRRGERRLTVMWVPGEGSPEAFYLRLGFRPTGEELSGQVIAELPLDG